MNLVEICASDEEQKPSPCEFGNIVTGHSCYCHYVNGPRKCHVWQLYGDGPSGWDEKACAMFKKASNAGIAGPAPTIAAHQEPHVAGSDDLLRVVNWIQWRDEMTAASNEVLARALLTEGPHWGPLSDLIEIAAERLCPGIIELMAVEQEAKEQAAAHAPPNPVIASPPPGAAS